MLISHPFLHLCPTRCGAASNLVTCEHLRSHLRVRRPSSSTSSPCTMLVRCASQAAAFASSVRFWIQEVDGVQRRTIDLLDRADSHVAMAPSCATKHDHGDHVFEHPCTTRWAGVSIPTFGEFSRAPWSFPKQVRCIFVLPRHPYRNISGGQNNYFW